jgi:hypothetical protein
MVPTVQETYQLATLDFRLCRFDLSSARYGELDGGSIVWGGLLRSDTDILDVVLKVVDACRYPDAAETLQEEANAYAALYGLQGKAIPNVFGLYEVWGILHVLALEPVGDALSAEGEIDPVLLRKMKAALGKVHRAGFVHGNITRSSFCRREKEVFLVDLKSCQRATKAQRDREMFEVDAL